MRKQTDDDLDGVFVRVSARRCVERHCTRPDVWKETDTLHRTIFNAERVIHSHDGEFKRNGRAEKKLERRTGIEPVTTRTAIERSTAELSSLTTSLPILLRIIFTEYVTYPCGIFAIAWQDFSSLYLGLLQGTSNEAGGASSSKKRHRIHRRDFPETKNGRGKSAKCFNNVLDIADSPTKGQQHA